MSTFVILLISIIIVLVINMLILKGVRGGLKHIAWNKKGSKWIIITYVSILLLAVVVYEFIPFNGDEVITQKEFQKLENENLTFNQAFRNNEVNKLDSKFLEEEISQELSGDTLHIVSPSSDHPTAKVYVDWTDSKKQLVEGKVYRTNLTMYGIDFKEKIQLSKIELEGDKLIIQEPAEKELRFYRFSNQLAVLSIDGLFQRYEYGRASGDTYIYLKVPKHINVVDEMGFQIY
ncbi:hypothetical protein ACFVR1_13355 [Psychrobacillus sp. NPDC058041]|uniref:hypothetical protein n=1 Tax=Psychrobacillus sp. NPDC058041 TaxID=3346310 RepID=UPI0036DA8F5C